MPQTKAAVALFTLAGIGTERGFMDPIREELSLWLRSRGYPVKVASLYPYGDWTRRIAAQVLEIVWDWADIHERFWSSLGTRAAWEPVLQAAADGCTVLLVGHSGGGVTAIQLAALLIRAGHAPPLVVQIGCPKCPIRDDMKDRVLYLYGMMDGGGRKDPIVRLGGWGGWVRRGGIPLWKRDAHAPDAIAGFPLVGGHPDYFRGYRPYINEEGNSNLEQTLRPLLPWLERKLAAEGGEAHR
ncbi:hypothetical protein [Paenibacillus hamazuiensis]|uniref:hypothetical protein n=1 Tax=Paenibacillus hamazuiensis TaxID=2936508 RepID=UPI00200D97FA|nr:hypothetical protein [Paenibacillus hamazuiensis]